MTFSESLAAILHRELETMRREVEAYPDEAQLWTAVPGLTNSGGVLVRHLCGNIQHFIGTVLGGTAYRRDREAEFLAPPTPRAALLAEITATEAAVATTLATFPSERLAAPFPIPVVGQALETQDLLLHLAAHCAFHLGQLDYHRRAATGATASVAPMSIPALASARPAATG